MSVKEIFRKLHLILGLASGIIIFLVSITGAIYVFNEEIKSITEPFRKVEAENREPIPPSRAFEIGKSVNPDKHMHGLVYGARNEAIEVIFYEEEPEFYASAFLNPYSGEVLKYRHNYETFFGLIFKGHVALWLPTEIGTPIIKAAVIIFLILIISGLILWWPRKGQSTKSFSFTSKAPSSVVRLELHKVVGFYVLWFALILIFTGMVWLFEDVEKGVYKALGGEKEIVFSYPESDITQKQATTAGGSPVDAVWAKIRDENPEIEFLEIHAVESPESPVFVEINRDPSTYWKMDFLFFDQYTLEEIQPEHAYGKFDEAGLAEKVRRLNYDIHTGAVWGLPGKILAFIVSIFCASLPVTGFILWWKRQQQKKKFLMQMEI
ncbi:MAG: PepSY-associated TM helix domain-containing protein [Mariniphaga sp.]